MIDYCPISLCNVLYKLFSKVLANRLKKLLPKIITEHQYAFVKDRLITDNILIAFETLHCMKNYESGSLSYVALKLDLSKTYDQVEWNFLEKLMMRMGFNDRWVGLIMTCVKTVTYLVLVNGEPKWLITSSRGIRQGDPPPPSQFFFVRRGYMVLSNKLQIVVTLLALHFVDDGLNSLTYFLQMIAFCFA